MAKLQSLVLILACVLLATSVQADLSTSPDGFAGEVQQGRSATITASVANTGTEDYDITLITAATLSKGGDSITSTSVNPNAFDNIEPTQMLDFDVVFDVNQNQAVGIYSGTLTVEYTNGTEDKTLDVDLDLEVLANTAPAFTSTAPSSATVGTEYSYSATANDPEGNDLVFAKVSGEGVIDADSGLFTWTPTSTSTNNVVISVSDGIYTTEQSFSITASVIGGTLTFSTSSIDFGGNSQERDEIITKTVTIKNEGTQSVSDITFSNTLSKVYEFNISAGAPSTLAAGQSADLVLSLFIPLEQDAGEDPIGNLVAKGKVDASDVSSSVPVTLTAENHLVFSDMDIDYGDDDDNGIDDGDDFEVKPGDEIELSIEVENTFDDDYEIENIEVEIFDDGDFDWDENQDYDDLKDGDDDKMTFTYTVPLDIDEDNFDIEIEVSGEDENNARHGEIWTLTFQVEKDSRDLRITETDISPSSATCGASVRMNIEVTNTGSKDLEKGALRITNDQLDLEKIITRIEVDEGDDITEAFSFVIPDNVALGEYVLYVEVFTSGDDDDLTDLKTEVVNVISCNGDDGADEEEEEESDDSFEINVPATPATPGNQVVTTTTGSKGSLFGGSDSYIGLLIAVIVLLLILIVVVGLVAFRK